MNDSKITHGEPTGVRVLALTSPSALGRNIAHNIGQWNRVTFHAGRLRCPKFSAAAIAAIVLALAAMIAAMLLLDATATQWARHLPPEFPHVFDQVSNAGLSGWFLVPSGIVVLCFAAINSPALPRLDRAVLSALAARFLFVFWAIAAPGLFTTTIKRLIGRARPYMDVHGNPFTYMPFSWNSEYASLPSGHAATAASVAVAIGALWPRTRPFTWLYALLVMFSRVVVMAHHPSDVIAGALVGAVGAAWVRRFFAARGLVFSARTLLPLPGPSLPLIGRALRDAALADTAAPAAIERQRDAS